RAGSSARRGAEDRPGAALSPTPRAQRGTGRGPELDRQRGRKALAPGSAVRGVPVWPEDPKQGAPPPASATGAAGRGSTIQRDRRHRSRRSAPLPASPASADGRGGG